MADGVGRKEGRTKRERVRREEEARDGPLIPWSRTTDPPPFSLALGGVGGGLPWFSACRLCCVQCTVFASCKPGLINSIGFALTTRKKGLSNSSALESHLFRTSADDSTWFVQGRELGDKEVGV